MKTRSVRILGIFLLLSAVQIFAAAPPNDNFANPTEIIGFPASADGDTTGATVEPGEPGGLPTQQSIWFKWTPDFTGRIALKDNGSNVSAWIKIFSGTQFDSLTNLAATGLYNALIPLNVTAGNTYYFAVDVNGQNSLPGPVHFQLINLPSNDNFTDAKPLVGTMIEDFTDDSLATLEDGEPDYSANSLSHSLWWKWTAPSNDTVRLSLTGSVGNQWVYVFTGDVITNLALIAENNFGSDVSFNAVAGTEYKIRVEGGFSTGVGKIRLALYPSTPPNDNFENRLPLEGTPLSSFGTTINATSQTGEPQINIFSGGRSVWYSWTAPKSGRLELSATNYTGHPLIPRYAVGIFTGDQVNTLQTIATGEDGTAGMIVANQTYAIGVDGDSGDFRLALNVRDFPANDNFSNRIALSGAQPYVSSDNIAGTLEPGEKSPASGMAGASVWYQWTAPAAGLVRFYASAGFVPVVSVYKGTALKKLKKVANSLNVNSTFSFCQLQVKSGDTFVISVDGRYPEGRGTFIFGIDVTTFQIANPTAGATISAANPPLFSVNSPSPVVDGALQSVTYYIAQGDGETHTVGFSTTPPFSVVPTNLPVGLVALYALGTNDSGGVRQTDPIIIKVQPPNDNFSNSIPLQGYHWEASGYTSQASKEKGEPNSGAASVWYSWTAPSSGSMEIESQLGDEGSAMRKRSVVVYSGPDLKHLKRVPWTKTDDEPSASQYFYFNAVGGTTYQIVVAAKNANIDPGTWPFLLRGNLTSLSFSQPSDSVFHEPADVPVGVTTAENPATIQRVDFFATDRYETNELIGSVTAPPYQFIWTNAPPGDYSLEAHAVKFSGPTPLTAYGSVSIRPLNDDFTNSIVIETNFTWLTHRIAGASSEASEPASAWWNWTAPTNGRVYVGNPNSDAAAGIAIYTGTNVANLARVTNHNDPFYGPAEVVDVTQGTTYQIAASPGFIPTANVQFRFYPPPPNDNFSNRTVLTGSDVELDGYTVQATREPGEPNHGGFTNDHTVWWSWTAPARGHFTLRQDAGSWVISAVYTGDSLASLTPTPSFSGGQFETLPGVTYQIALVSYWGNEEHIAFNLHFTPTVANDSFGARQTIDNAVMGATEIFMADNRGASSETNEPPIASGGSGRTLWWTWTARMDGNVYIAAPANSSFPHGSFMLDVFTGESLDTLVPISGGGGDRLSLHAISNVTYQIRFDSAAPVTEELPLSFEFIPSPANDNFSSASTITGFDITFNDTLYGASQEGANPPTAIGEPSVWYAWTAPATKPVTVVASGNNISAYTGASVSNLLSTGVQHNYDSLQLDAQAGQTYYFKVASIGLWEPDYPWAGGFQFQLFEGAAPANDNFASSQVLTGSAGSLTVTNWAASLEPTDPPLVNWDQLKRTVWYSFQAPTSGTFVITNNGSSMAETIVGLYTNSSFGHMVGGGLNSGVAHVSSNQLLNILIDGNSGAGGVLSFGWAFVPDAQSAAAAATSAVTSQSVISPQTVLSPGGLASGQFTLHIQGTPGASYKVEWSSDLLHWQLLTSGTLINAEADVVDTNAMSATRYYRLAP